MNYLAHAFLARPTPHSLIGNWAPDFGSTLGPDIHPEFAHGIRLHHWVDAFTDGHPAFLRTRAHFAAYRALSGVIADIVFDHVLARDWPRYCAEPLQVFVARVYAQLESHLPLCPPHLQNVLPHMVREDWLGSYQTLDGLRLALQRITRRTKRAIDLSGAVPIVEASNSAITTDFHAFFKDLRTACPSEF